jgi:energy-coupling factor transporter ATP-binding protein EcfA2
MSQDLKVLQSYYKSFKNIAENKSDEEFQLLHIEDKVENFVRDKLNNNKIVIVTGSPGDGKTHLIKYLQPNIPSNTKIILDANENTDEIIKSIEDYHQKKEPLVIAINEGVLLNCAQESDIDIAKYLIDCILYQYIYLLNTIINLLKTSTSVNLKNRNNLNQIKIERISRKNC